MNKIYYFLLLFPILIIAQEPQIIRNEQLYRKFMIQDTSEVDFKSPLILSNSILFYYQGEATSVFLAGDFNNWQKKIPLIQSRSNLWVTILTNRLPKGKYKYRLEVDGFWIPDPSNDSYELDRGNQTLSILEINNDFTPNKKYPFWVSNNTYLFQFHNTNANIVTVVGDFNDWNPYSQQLIYKGAGYFEIEIELEPKKIYLYSFIQDGIWIYDPNNKKQYRNNQNRPVSGFYADQINSIP